MELPSSSRTKTAVLLGLGLALGIAGGVGGRLGWKRWASRPDVITHEPSRGDPQAPPLHEPSSAAEVLRMGTTASLPAFFSAVETATAAQIAGMAQDLLAHPNHARDDALWALVVARWAQVDAAAMMAFVTAHRGDTSAALPAMAWKAWGAAFPSDAFGAVISQPNPLRRAMLSGVAAVDPAQAATFALRVPDAQFALHSVLAELAREDQAAALSLLPRAVYDGARESIYRAVAAELARTNPQQALALARKAGRIWNDREAETLAAIARHHPSQALAMVEAMPSSRAKALSSVAVAKTLAANDPEAALSWTRSALTGPVRDAALVEIAALTGGADPVAGLELVAESGWRESEKIYLIDQESRDTVTAVTTAALLLRQWAAGDAAGAQAWLEAHAPQNIRSSVATAAGLTP